jgi:hypothetical protein
VVATLETSAPSAALIRFAPENGNVFATLVFKGTCSEAGEQPVDGRLVARSIGASAELAKHPLEGLGTTENNSLELLKGKAYLEKGKALIELASGLEFSFHS